MISLFLDFVFVGEMISSSFFCLFLLLFSHFTPSYCAFWLGESEFERLKKTLKTVADSDRNVMIAESNEGFLEMTSNFLYHANRTDPPLSKNLLFFPLDEQLDSVLQSQVKTFFSPEIGTFTQRAESFRHGGYNKIVKEKWYLAMAVLAAGYNVLVSDVDVVWRHNIFPLLKKSLPVCDVLFYCNAPDKTSMAECDLAAEVNTGIMYFRSTRATLVMIDMFLRYNYRPHLDDQSGYNEFFRDLYNGLAKPDQSQIENTPWFRSLPNQNLNDHPPSEMISSPKKCGQYDFLTVGTFTSNQVTFPWQMKELKPKDPYGIHFNFLNGFRQKQNEMKKMGYWMERSQRNIKPQKTENRMTSNHVSFDSHVEKDPITGGTHFPFQLI